MKLIFDKFILNFIYNKFIIDVENFLKICRNKKN